MKFLSRGFSIKEKVLILVLLLVLLGLAYYEFVDQPVRNSIDKAESEKDAYQVELSTINSQIAKYESMKNEIDSVSGSGVYALMPSYNNSKTVNQLLNDVLGSLGYTITFANVAPTGGNMVRRNISIQFTAPDEDTVQDVLYKLTNCGYRCLIGDLSCAPSSSSSGSGYMSVSTTVTFYETLVGGEVDPGIQK